MLTARQGTFLTAVSLGSLLILLTSCTPPGGADRQIEELRAEVDALKAEVQQLNNEVAALKGVPVRSARPQVAETQPSGPVTLNIGASAVLGSDSAPVTMFAYNDYTCSECASFASEVLPRILSKYVDTGRLRIVMREAPDRQAGRKAVQRARIAVCSGQQGKYKEMQGLLFTFQDSREELMARVKQLNLNEDEFKSCMRDEGVGSQIRADAKEAVQSPIKSAPGFLLGLTNPDNRKTVEVAKPLSGMPKLADFEAAIDELLAQADASG